MTVSLDLAISAIKAGRKEEGRQLLNLLIQQDPNAELAWLWMSSVVKTDEQRARCLYHVLSINPKNELAHRGLQILGITVSDSRPVRVPRDSEPIHIPQPSVPNGTQTEPKPALEHQSTSAADASARRPFLIDMDTITAELPFVPARSPAWSSEEIQASPDILALEVDEDNHSKKTDLNGTTVVEGSAVSAADKPDKTSAEASVKAAVALEVAQTVAAKPDQKLQVEQGREASDKPGDTQEQPVSDVVETTDPTNSQEEVETSISSADASAETSRTTPESPGEVDTGKMAGSPEPPATSGASEMANQSQLVQDNIGNGQSAAGRQQISVPGNNWDKDGMPPPGQPFETRPSQPIPIEYPVPNMGLSQNDPTGYGVMSPDRQYQHHGAGTMPMPHYPMVPGSMPIHGNPTMNMPYGQYQRHPSEPVPVIIHPSSIFPPSAYPPGHSFHSSATTLMPTFSELGMPQGQAIPTASGAAMPLQNMGWGTHPEFRPHAEPQPYPRQEEDEAGEEDGEINILAVIIFGTLSLTALGGIGMLILLFITTSSVPG